MVYTTANHLCRYDPSSTSTKELHGLNKGRGLDLSFVNCDITEKLDYSFTVQFMPGITQNKYLAMSKEVWEYSLQRFALSNRGFTNFLFNVSRVVSGKN